MLKVEPYAVYDESLIIGDNCVLGSHCVIKENVRIGNNTIIGPHVVIESGAIIGNNITIHPFSVIARDSIIEDNVFIAPFFGTTNDKFISSGEHGTSPNKKPFVAYPPIIREGARIGERVTLAPGIEIGKHALIDMCCLITKNVPDYAHVRSDKLIAGRIYEG